MKSILHTLSLVLAGGVLAASAACADVRKGVEDFQRANFAAALKELVPHAEKGDPTAQYVVGKIYYAGLGVEKNAQRAVDLYKKAAEGGHIDAQFDLGRALALGDGTGQDIIEGVKWFILASEAGHKDAEIYVRETGRSMTRTDFSTARVRALNWRKEFDARRGRPPS